MEIAPEGMSGPVSPATHRLGVAGGARREGRNPLRIARAVTYVLLAAAVARFWIAPLGSSFWQDETGTFWTIKDGLLPMFARLQEWPTSITAAYGLVCSAAYAL